jgi:hypothetical protein
LQKLDPIEEEKRLVVNVETPAEGEVKMSVQSIHDIPQIEQEQAGSVEGVEVDKNAEQAAPAAEEVEVVPVPETQTAALQVETPVQRVDCESINSHTSVLLKWML